MAQDNRLFSANSPIGRIWYYINLFILGILFSGTHIAVKDYILPNANANYEIPVKAIGFFIYFILTITFFMLIDRRIFDISGARDSATYRLLSKIVSYIISILIIVAIAVGFKVALPDIVIKLTVVVACVFAMVVFILGLIPGKITSPKS